MPLTYIDPTRFFEVDRIAFDKGVSKDDCGFTVFLDKDGKHIEFEYQGHNPNYTHISKMICTSKLEMNNVPINLKTIHQSTFGYPHTETLPQEEMKCRVEFGDRVENEEIVEDVKQKHIYCYTDTEQEDKPKSPDELLQEFDDLKGLLRDIKQARKRLK